MMQPRWLTVASIVGLSAILLFLVISYPKGSSQQGSPQTAGILGSWCFRDIDGDILFARNQSYNDAGIINATWNSSKRAMEFNPEEYMFIPPPNTLMPEAAITISVWVNLRETGSKRYSGILGKNGHTSGYRLLIQNDSLRLLFQLTGQDGERMLTQKSIEKSTWYHVAAVYDGKKLQVYTNGLKDPAEKSVSGPIDPNSEPVTIGKAYFGYNGFIDDVRIYGEALSTKQISVLYEEGRHVNCSPKTG